MKPLAVLAAALCVSASSAVGPVRASEPAVLDAQASDPLRMGWMQGSPPPPEKRISGARGEHMRFPMSRYGFSHMREFVPTKRISRDPRHVWPLPVALRSDIDEITFFPIGSDRAVRWDESLLLNYTDAIIVLHRGRIVYERYFGVTGPDTRHLAFSATKSFVGTLAEILIAEGKLDETSPVSRYVPELVRSGFGDATVRQVMDMTAGVDFSEDYTDATSDIVDLAKALGGRPADYAGPADVYAYLETIGHKGRHGERFTYRSANTEVLGWVLARAEGKPLETILEEKLWRPLEMESEADFLIDPAGKLFAAGGLNLTLRDFARFGEAMRLCGKAHGRQVIPASAIDSIRRGGRQKDFAEANYAFLPGWSYHSQWWITHDADGAFMARGVNGQALYVDPAAEVVIARFASHPVASNIALDPTSLPAYRALAAKLSNGGRTHGIKGCELSS